MANIVDPDETPPSAASHLGLHCLLRPVCPNIHIYGKYGSYLFQSFVFLPKKMVGCALLGLSVPIIQDIAKVFPYNYCSRAFRRKNRDIVIPRVRPAGRPSVNPYVRLQCHTIAPRPFKLDSQNFHRR